MSLTLGEKLREAREGRGYTISEVAEQTRISPLYIESIENDDYSALPGGIFNKGFVKSFAKFVGLNEQEALQDYSNLLARSEAAQPDDQKPYKPQVLTDDGPGRSMIPTLIGAVVILGLLTGAILVIRSYLTGSPSTPQSNLTAKNAASPEPETPANSNSATAPSGDTPDMATLKVEFKALSQPISLSSTTDGKFSSSLVAANSSQTFEPKESLKLGYSRSLAQFVELLINGKKITLPATPLNPKRAAIEFEINKETLPQIWKSGAISTDVAAANPDANIAANTVAPVSTPAVKPATPKPTPAANTSTAGNSAPKPTSTAAPKPTPKSTVAPPPATNRQ